MSLATLDSRHVLVTRLRSTVDDSYPLDEVGILATIPAVKLDGNHAPLAQGSLFGRGKLFAGSGDPVAYGWVDVDQGHVFEQRKGFAAILVLDWDMDADAIPAAYCNDSDEYGWAIRLEVVDAASRIGRVRCIWHNTSGTLQTPGGALFKFPPSGQSAVLGVTRYIEDGVFKVEYVLDGLFGDVVEHSDASQMVTGAEAALTDWRFTLGAGWLHFSSAIDSPFAGIIEHFEVLSDHVLPEELRWNVERFEDMRDAYHALRALQPPKAWSTDPESRIQRILKIEGAALGVARNASRRASDYFLPSTAFGERLQRWESLYRVSPNGGDSWQQRRAAVLARMGTVRGFSDEDLKAQILALLGCTDESELTTYAAGDSPRERAGYHSDTFTSSSFADNWLVETGALTSVAYLAGKCRLYKAGPGFNDIRYPGIDSLGASSGPGFLLWPIKGEADVWTKVVVSNVTMTQTVASGIMLGDRVADEWLFVGWGYKGGSFKPLLWTYKDGAIGSESEGTALSDLGAGITVTVRRNADDPAQWDWSITNGTSTQTGTVDGPETPRWVGSMLSSPPSGTGVSAATAYVDNFEIWDQASEDAHSSYIYRDPAAPATAYSLEKAQALIDQVGPAHTRIRVIDQVDGLNCDDTASLTDRDWIGDV